MLIFTLKLLGALVMEMETASRSGGPSLTDGSKENCNTKGKVSFFNIMTVKVSRYVKVESISIPHLMEEATGEEEHLLLGKGFPQALPLADTEGDHGGVRVKLSHVVEESIRAELVGVWKNLRVAVHLAQVGDYECLPIEGVSPVGGVC